MIKDAILKYIGGWYGYLAVLLVGISIGWTINGWRMDGNVRDAQDELKEFKTAVAEGVTQMNILRVTKQAESEKSKVVLLSDFSTAFIQQKGKYDAVLKQNNHNLAIAVSDANSLREQASNYRSALGEVLISSKLSTESGGDCNTELANGRQYTEALKAACMMTTIDYDALRTAWDQDCEIKGCE